MKNIRIVSNVFYLLFIIIFISCNNESVNKKGDGDIENKLIKVAVFNGSGASTVCIAETYEALKIDTGIVSSFISASEISAGKLYDFDVIVFPGGSASKELNNLGEDAASKVVEYVKAGYGAVGICAGGYLFSTTKDYPSLKLVSATEWDREHYNKGRALVEFELTEKGYELFPELKNNKCFLQYYDGPVLIPSDSNQNQIFKYQEYARYVTDIKIHKGYPTNITPGKTFLLSESVGEGRAMVIAGHPESTPGMRWLVPRMARWAANESIIRYNDKWIRPEIYTEAILFKKNLVKDEKKHFWKLLANNSDDKIEAMQSLWELHSRPAVRWNMGMLRDKNPEVRAKAAFLLMQAEYTASLPDLLAAYKLENDSLTKEIMKESIEFLSEY